MLRDATWPEEVGERRVVAVWIVIWAALGLLLVLQGALERALDGGTGSAGWLLRWRVAPWALWGLTAPVLARLGGLLPLEWPPRGKAVAVHTGVFAAWMVVSNAVLRIPELVGGLDAALTREVLAAAAEYSVPGALAYFLIARAGRALWSERGEGTPAAARLSLNTGERIHLVPIDEVRWIEADGDYVRVHTEGRVHRVRGRMKRFERQLPDARFLRLHRSTIVNVDFVRELQPYFNGDYVAVLRDGTTLRVPRTRRAVSARFLDG
jgi:hypothetical protein